MSCQICVGGDVISRENLLRDCEKVVTFGQLLVLDFTRWVNREQEEGETGSSGGPGAPRVPRTPRHRCAQFFRGNHYPRCPGAACSAARP